MVVHITTDDATRERVRQFIMTQKQVSVGLLGGELGFGLKRSQSLIDEFQTEGLISGPDRNYQHNVRQPDGILTEPRTAPRDPIDVVILGAIARLIMHLRGRDV